MHSRKGDCASLKDLQHLALPTEKPSDCDLTLLVGTTKTPQSHVLRLRWHNVTAAACMQDGKAMALHQALSKLLPKGGFEAIRRGGSSGATELNAHFFKFLHHNSNFPRRGNGVKLIRRTFGWDTLYVKPWHPRREVVSFGRYSQPQPGGSFHLPRELLLKFPVLSEFIKLKIYTAQVLEVLNRDHGYALQPLAVRKTLDDLKEAKSFSGNIDDILSLVSSKNMYSMVCYPVGYHVDTFEKNMPSLENKLCFINKRWKGTKGCGRGGAGPNQYVWALLDWTSARQGERRRQYLALGGDPSNKVTQAFWDNWKQNNN